MSAASDPEKMRDALAFAAPSSPAFAYMTHQANSAEAQLDAGLEMVDEKLTRQPDGSYESCNASDSQDCAVFAGFKANAEGELVDFTVNGKAIASRIVMGSNKPVKFGTATITFLTAYQTITSNSLFVTLKVETAGKSLEIWNGSYRGTDKKVRDVQDIVAPQKIPADSSALAIVVVPGMKAGGTLSLIGLEPNTKEVTTAIKIG